MRCLRLPSGVQQGVEALKHLSQAGRDGEEDMACPECFPREIGSGCYASECDRVSAVCRFVWRGTVVQAVGDGLRQDEEEEEEGSEQCCECLRVCGYVFVYDMRVNSVKKKWICNWRDWWWC